MTTEAKAPRVNVMQYEGKGHMLSVVRAERQAFWELMDSLDDRQWQAQSACTEWQVRDLVAHMVDVTEAYLERWAIARAGQPFPEPRGLRVMARGLDEGAKRFRAVPRGELLARLKEASHRLFEIFDGLTAEQWTGEIVPHVYMGPLPAFIYPAFQLMDYSVHRWDAQQGLGIQQPLTPDAAGTLVPFMFILLQSTLDADRAQGVACTCGIRIAGPYGGEWRVNVADGKLTYDAGSAADCPAVLDFDASDFVLTCFQRVAGGRPSGNLGVVQQFRELFFKI